jgi:hypothetical protein
MTNCGDFPVVLFEKNEHDLLMGKSAQSFI